MVPSIGHRRMDDRSADRDDRQTVFLRFVTSNRHIKNTRCVQNTLDPVYSVDFNSELRFEPFPHPKPVELPAIIGYAS